MMADYSLAQWKVDQSSDQVGQLRLHDPSWAEIVHRLHDLYRQHPDLIRLELLGQSVCGNDLWLLEITDPTIAAAEKETALLYACEHGDEHTATLALLQLIHWLLSPAAQAVRRQQRVLIIPCVNPDGYETFHQDNANGVNLFADYSFDHPPTQPESRAVYTVLEQHQPELVVSCHGIWLETEWAAIENCQGSYGNSGYDRCHSRLFAEKVNLACENAGYPQDRMEEDAERILRRDPEWPNHSFRSGDKITGGVYAYQRFHSLHLTAEIMFLGSGLKKLQTILQLGCRPWRYEPVPGYPVRVMTHTENFCVCSYGRNAEERRRSRIELWPSCEQLQRYFLPWHQDRGFLGFAVSIVPADLEIAARAKSVDDFLQGLPPIPELDLAALRQALGPVRLSAKLGLMREAPPLRQKRMPFIRCGLSLRARLLPGSKIKRVLINGHLAPRSRHCGYQTWTPKRSFQFLQLNIPPGKSPFCPDGKLQRLFCTIEYEPGHIPQ